MGAEEDVAAVWNENAAYWSENVRSGKDRIRDAFLAPAFFDFLGDVGGQRLLDLGCGEGTVTRELRRRGAEVTGVDISERFIALARAAEREAPLGISYGLGSCCTLEDFAPDSFDRVTATMVLMDSPRLDDVMQSAQRVLRPGGTFFFSVIHPCFWPAGWPWEVQSLSGAKLAAKYWTQNPYTEPMDFKLLAAGEKAGLTVLRFPYRLETYINALANAGFAVDRISEARPGEEMVAQHSWLAILRNYLPLFLFVSAVKRTGH